MELYAKHEITVNPNEISHTGVIKIDAYLAREQLPYPVEFCLSEWISTEGDYRGKLPNRLGGLYKKVHNIKLTPKQRSEIGNIAKAHLSKAKYTFDFVDEFDWKAGDFGDKGSCFWGDRSLALTLLKEEGALAMLFYEDYDADCGNGRAWIYHCSRDMWVLFNAYGLEGRSAAKVLAEYLTQSTDKLWDSADLDRFGISGDTIGLVYINANPQIIFVSGSEPPNIVNLDWARYAECDSCCHWILEVDLCCVDDENMCYTCAQDYTECDRCGRMFFSHDEEYVLEEKAYCPDCYIEREEEIEEELRLDRLEMKQHAARIIQEAESLISSLTYDEQVAAGQLQFGLSER